MKTKLIKKKILCFDLDNVICTTQGRNYHNSKPKKNVIRLINDLYNSGHTIKIFTARYMGRNNDVIDKAIKQGYSFTKEQINSWGLNYHNLLLGKPTYDIFVDDRTDNFKKNWYINFKKRNKII